MRFWDTSALTPLLVQEPRTQRVRELLEADADLAVWWGTPVECWSVVSRRVREGSLSPTHEDQITARLEVLRNVW